MGVVSNAGVSLLLLPRLGDDLLSTYTIFLLATGNEIIDTDPSKFPIITSAWIMMNSMSGEHFSHYRPPREMPAILKSNL